MKTIILLLGSFGLTFGALVPVGPPAFYSNFISQRRPEFPVQSLDGLNSYVQQQYVTYDVPQVNTAVRTIPTAVFANGRPTIAHIPTTYNYYGTPVYDFRFPFNGISPPGSIPSSPGYIPRPEVPQLPNDPSDDDGIEKLDEKVDPAHDPLGEAAGAANSGEESDENDTVSVEAA